MRDSLKTHIRELTEATAARERLESELAVARRIQAGMVPAEVPPFPGGERLDLRAILEPARQVGGDLYDFFVLDDGRLCIVVGDVSGKGIPAALFMARTITLVKAAAREERSPDGIVAKVNVELCRRNESCLFVTLFCAIVDAVRGELCYANAGHNPPLLARRGERAVFLRGGECIALGVEEEAAFKEATVSLSDGDTLFLYTDGVTEAFDPERRMFSEPRLVEEVSARAGDSAAELAEGILQRIREHAGDAPQSDDITMVVLKYGVCAARGSSPDGGAPPPG